jgi:hypothetical protein
MKRVTLFILFIIIMPGLSAQVNKYGTPVSKSYGMNETHGAEQNWAVIKDKFGAVWFGGDEALLVRFDGTTWTRIPFSLEHQTVIRSLASDENGIVYVGGSGEIGYVEPDSTGTRVYRSMNDKLLSAVEITSSFSNDTSAARPTSPSERTIGEIRSLVIKDSKVYFMSSGSLMIYNTLTDSLVYVNLRKVGFRQSERIFRINDKIIIANNIRGLFELKDDTIEQLTGGDYFAYKMCLTILPFTESKVIVATLSNGVYLFDYSTGKVDNDFIEHSAAEKIKNLYIYCGVMLPGGEFALGTTSDGVYVFNEKGEATGHFKSTTVEMNDDGVTALYTDPDLNSELWISATGSVTKVYVNMPFTQFSSRSGINGSINNIKALAGDIYIATDQGLFKSTIDTCGIRRFNLHGNLNSQIFALCVASMPSGNFMLAGTQFDGIYQIFPDGRSVKLGITSDPTRSIYQSDFLKTRFFVGTGTSVVYILDFKNNKWKHYGKVKVGDISGVVQSYCELGNGDLIMLATYPDGVYKLPFNDSIPVLYTPEQGVPKIGLTGMFKFEDDILVSTSKGLIKLNKTTDKWEPCDYLTGGYTSNKYVDGLYLDEKNNLWVATNEERYHDILFTRENDSVTMTKGGSLGALPNMKFLYSDIIENRVWLTKSSSIYVIDESKLSLKLKPPQTLLTKIFIATQGSDSVIMNETFYRKGTHGKHYPVTSNAGLKSPEFRYKLNSPSFYWTTPYMIQEEEILYSYKLEGYQNEWSDWVRISYKDFTNLSYGKYTFRVKAKTITGIESQEASYSFIILKPWYATPWMILVYFIAATLAVIGIIMAYTKRLKNENIRLEGIVAERTAVVVKQKEELESSIHYASRIQMALLPSESILAENIKNYFILFKPRDIVSGDFYWMTKKNDRLYIVAADCTGHGVPGAFMSLLGMSFLDEIIDKETAPRADFVLNQLRLHVTDSLKQVGGDDEAKDGIDMALLVVDFTLQRVEFSGAYNPCFRIRKLAEHEIARYSGDSSDTPEGTMSNGRYLLETIYSDKMPIGISSRMNENFSFYNWKLEKGMAYYLFSDGYIDQFGGNEGRKFMKKNFKRLLLDIQDYPMSKQKEALEKNLKDWMGSTPQIDDILVMGIRTE